MCYTSSGREFSNKLFLILKLLLFISPKGPPQAEGRESWVSPRFLRRKSNLTCPLFPRRWDRESEFQPPEKRLTGNGRAAPCLSGGPPALNQQAFCSGSHCSGSRPCCRLPRPPAHTLPPAVVGQCAVGLGHLVHVMLSLDHRAPAVEGLQQLLRQLLRHQHPPGLLLPTLSDHPLHGQEAATPVSQRHGDLGKAGQGKSV